MRADGGSASRVTDSLDVPGWSVLLPLPETATVLGVGAGVCSVAHALAQLYGRIIAVDSSPTVVASTQQRALEARAANVQSVEGLPEELPVRRRSVDLVLLGDTLGRVRRAAPAGRGGEAERRLLRAVKEALKPGGWVVLSVDNRVAVRCDAWRDASLRTVWGYRRVLVTAGYGDIRIWCALPNQEQPRYLVPCRQPQFSHFLRRLDTAPRSVLRTSVRALLHRLGLLKFTSDSYCIIARSSENIG